VLNSAALDKYKHAVATHDELLALATASASKPQLQIGDAYGGLFDSWVIYLEGVQLREARCPACSGGEPDDVRRPAAASARP